MATRTSSKYTFPRKVLIQSGPPAIYQLKSKSKNIGTLTRKTVGEKNPNKKNKTILLVGETGTGKSTLINALVNYAMGVKFEENVWYQIVEDEKKSQSESQTTDVIVYEIFGFEDKTLPYSLTIIDTPGYGDTRGIEHDVIVGERLFNLFHSDDGVHEMNAVGLVLKASDNRLSERLRYIFDSVVSLFGKNMEEKIVALITHSDGVTPENVLRALEDSKIVHARNKKDQPVHFMFNNRQSTKKTIENRVALKGAWDFTKVQMDQFTNFLKKTKPQKLETTVAVLKARIRLTACIQNLQERIEFTELRSREIQQTQEALKQHEQEMKDNEKFTVEVDEVYKFKVPIDGGLLLLWPFIGAVCCTVCEENCHYPGCTFASIPSHCEVMKDGRCTSCTGKCPESVHVKEEQCIVCEGECCKPELHVKTMWRYASKTRKVLKTLQHMKEKYEEGKTGCEDTASLLETLEKNMEELQREKIQLLEKSFQYVVDLEEIALKVDSLSTFVHLDFLIERMKEKGDTEKVRKLEEMEGQMNKDEGTIAALRYAHGKLTGAGKTH